MGYERQKDFGTPVSKSTDTVTLTIDGREVTVPAGTSVMRAAAEIGGDIPKLCATDNVESFGSCRLCLVEIDGAKGTPASCTTPVAQGMDVHTQTPRLEKLRRGVMELYISDHPLDCLTCSANNDCELQDQAAAVGLRDVRYGYEGDNHLALATDHSNPYFDFDPSKCIVCCRCVRACDEVQGTFALTIDGRGFASKVSAGQDGDDFLSSECVSCGACVQACPTATLQEKSVKRDRQARARCRHHLRLLRRRLHLPRRDARRAAGADGALQGRQGQPRPQLRQGPLRLGLRQPQGPHPAPMIRELIDQPWREVSWDEAIAYTAGRLRGMRETTAPARLAGSLEPLHQRGDLPGPETGPRGLRRQQRRYLCPGLPFADRLRPEDHLRHHRRHAGFRLGRWMRTSSW